jgi:glycosyltransferase involved in cell wall biosynthesis
MPIKSNLAPSDESLTVVMPVHNEDATIEIVVQEWTATLDALHIPFTFLVINDSSTDNTLAVLQRLQQSIPQLRIKHHTQNQGHGASILEGYREAQTTWVFQTDGDNEMKSTSFEHFWQIRGSYDFLLGYRTGRSSPLPRRLITAIARYTVNLCFRARIEDVNTPYRLMRTVALQRLLPSVPAGAFAPNCILSGLAARHGLRIYQHGVPYQERRTGRPSLTGWKTWRAAVRSFSQTIQTARQHSPRAMHER